MEFNFPSYSLSDVDGRHTQSNVTTTPANRIENAHASFPSSIYTPPFGSSSHSYSPPPKRPRLGTFVSQGPVQAAAGAYNDGLSFPISTTSQEGTCDLPPSFAQESFQPAAWTQAPMRAHEGQQTQPHYAQATFTLPSPALPHAQRSFPLPPQARGPSLPSSYATHTFNGGFSRGSMALPQVPAVPPLPYLQSTGSAAVRMGEEGTLVTHSAQVGRSSSARGKGKATASGGKRKRSLEDMQVQEGTPSVNPQFERYAHIQAFPCCDKATQRTSLYMHYTTQGHLNNLSENHQKFVKDTFWIRCPNAGCDNQTNRFDEIIRHIGIDSTGKVKDPAVNKTTNRPIVLNEGRKECQDTWLARPEQERADLIKEWKRKTSKATARAIFRAASEASSTSTSSSSSSSSSSPVERTHASTPFQLESHARPGTSSSVSTSTSTSTVSSTFTASFTSTTSATTSDSLVLSSQGPLPSPPMPHPSTSNSLATAPCPLAALSVPSYGTSHNIPQMGVLASQPFLPSISEDAQTESWVEWDDMPFFGNTEEEIDHVLASLQEGYGYEL
ncbi:hypothetical protein EVG20_g8687 [Dentipellis fragilis]|uniref:Uncharacterized protein n=1 Tax=Dentipellis fragilis TaxID=205917 RepID=A0A4Y9Y3K1_9AGAM|nr:hypothetical protein EVG20_g8687 [Dentipellis fragilis]